MRITNDDMVHELKLRLEKEKKLSEKLKLKHAIEVIKEI